MGKTLKQNKIIGVNVSHSPTACLLDNGKVTKFLNEDRLINYKLFTPDTKTTSLFCLDKIFNEDINCIGYASYNSIKSSDSPTIVNNIHNKYKHKPFYYDVKKHHIYHAICGFYFSNFDEATCIIVDGGGAEPYNPGYQELETIIYINKNYYSELYKNLSIRKNLSLPRDYLNDKEEYGYPHVLKEKVNGTLVN